MILSHFSKFKMPFTPHVIYIQGSNPDGLLKPKGLWLSDENEYGWREWCIDNGFREETLKYRTDFNVNEKDILILRDDPAILGFTKKYGEHIPRSSMNVIRWDKVEKDYKGIMVTPYSWDLRMHEETFWYYGWDCASACIWDLSAVEKI